jgi:hypothetical protein
MFALGTTAHATRALPSRTAQRSAPHLPAGWWLLPAALVSLTIWVGGGVALYALL